MKIDIWANEKHQRLNGGQVVIIRNSGQECNKQNESI
jgi:hypothetical protein